MQDVKMVWSWLGEDRQEWPCQVNYLDGLLTVDCFDEVIWTGRQDASGQFHMKSDKGGAGTLRPNSAADMLEGEFEDGGYRGEWEIGLNGSLDIQHSSAAKMEMARRSSPDDNV